MLTLTWGAAAFGAAWPWGYVPLLVSSALLGVFGLVWGRASLPNSVILGCLAIAAAIGIQLVPVSISQLTQITPNAITFLNRMDVQFASGSVLKHPISIEPRLTLLGLAFMSALASLLLASSRVFSRNSARHFVVGLIVLGVALATVGIVQGATSDGKLYGFFEPNPPGVSYGPFVNRNHFAGWMLMAIPTSLGFLASILSRTLPNLRPDARHRFEWLASTEGNQVVLTGFAVLLMSLSLVLTLSRSGVLSFVVALAIFGAAATRRLRESGRTIAMLSLAALLIASLTWAGIDRVAARIGHQSTADGSGRLAIWTDTLNIVRDFWVTGTGLNTYSVSTVLYQTVAGDGHLGEAHNDYLQLAAEGGLLLAVPVIFTLGALIVHVRRRFQQDVGSIWWIRLGAVTGLAAIAVQSIFEFSLQMPGNAALFVVVVGLASHDGRRS